MIILSKNTIWFTSDLHLRHKYIIKYCNRPFRNVQEMTDQLMLNLRTKLQPGDDLYFLGDLSMNDVHVTKQFFKCFEDVKIHFIYGNHDNTKVKKIIKKHCIETSELISRRIEGMYIVMCHYPMRSWKLIKKGAWQLHGHSHGNCEEYNRQFDVGVDTNTYMPYSLEELKEILNKQPIKFADLEGESNDEDR